MKSGRRTTPALIDFALRKDHVDIAVVLAKLASPLFSAYFIQKLNKKLGTKLQIPKTLHNSGPTLF